MNLMPRGVHRGKAMRASVPRSAHAFWEPPPQRPDPVELLRSQDADRVRELLPIRYGRMLASPFAFFRGAALIMAADLATTPSSGWPVQLCGDAHLSNFGLFGTPERRLAFDLNDFDETHPGPWEWDVKRLATSVVVAGRERGFSDVQSRKAVLDTVSAYRTAMREFATLGALSVWYALLDSEALFAQYRAELDRRTVKQTSAILAKARTRDNLQAFAKLTHTVAGEPRIISDPPLIVPIEELAPEAEPEQLRKWVTAMYQQYRTSLVPERRRLLDQYRLVHLARKVVGVGSVGTRAWIALCLGADAGDPLLMQIKQAGPSVLEPYVGPSSYSSPAERVVAGQRLMQAAGDIFLGWHHAGADGDFYVRQLRDWKGSVDIERMNPRALSAYGRMCGWTLARAHARSGDRVAIAGYLGSGSAFDAALATFAEAYADQNERDYNALADVVASGRITASRGL
jgi:uncharacterized protein (DUF2252 family)